MHALAIWVCSLVFYMSLGGIYSAIIGFTFKECLQLPNVVGNPAIQEELRKRPIIATLTFLVVWSLIFLLLWPVLLAVQLAILLIFLMLR